MLVPQLAEYGDLALFLLRVVIALIFLSSGWSHLKSPVERGESIGLPPVVTRALGAAQVAAGVMLILGLWVQVAAAVLIGVMLGALYKKIFVWKKGFWGEGGGGWYDELVYLAANLVFLTTGGGGIGIG